LAFSAFELVSTEGTKYNLSVSQVTLSDFLISLQCLTSESIAVKATIKWISFPKSYGDSKIVCSAEESSNLNLTLNANSIGSAFC
jgi:hypothetical protein